MRPADGLRARRSTAWWTAALLIIGTVATLNNTLARPTPTDAGTASFGSLPPARLFESRQGQPTIDGTQQAVGRRTAEQITTIQVAGRGGVPTDADAVVINLTAIRPTGNGYLTAFPCGGPVPQASTLNYTRNSVVANGATVKLTNGTLCIYTKRATHLVVDVNGYHPGVAPPPPPTTTTTTTTTSTTLPPPSPPTVSALTPTSGTTAGGTSVVIGGSGFADATSVSFGAVPVPFSVLSPSTISAVSPPQASGPVQVMVTGPGGTSATGPSSVFTYVEPLPALDGVAAAGGPERVTFVWSPVLDPDVTGVQVEVGSSAAGPWTAAGTSLDADLSRSISGLVDDVTIFVRGRTIGPTRPAGPWSTPIAATPGSITYCGALTRNETWPAELIELTCPVTTAEYTLIIEAGATVESRGLTVGAGGTLVVPGDPALQTVLRSECSLVDTGCSTTAPLTTEAGSHITVRRARIDRQVVYNTGTTVDWSGNTFTASTWRADLGSPRLVGNSFSGADEPVSFHLSADVSSVHDNTATGTPRERVFVYNGASVTGHWIAEGVGTGIIHRIDDLTVAAGGHADWGPGVATKIANLRVATDGQLTATGTTTNPVIATRMCDQTTLGDTVVCWTDPATQANLTFANDATINWNTLDGHDLNITAGNTFEPALGTITNTTLDTSTIYEKPASLDWTDNTFTASTWRADLGDGKLSDNTFTDSEVAAYGCDSMAMTGNNFTRSPVTLQSCTSMNVADNEWTDTTAPLTVESGGDLSGLGPDNRTIGGSLDERRLLLSSTPVAAGASMTLGIDVVYVLASTKIFGSMSVPPSAVVDLDSDLELEAGGALTATDATFRSKDAAVGYKLEADAGSRLTVVGGSIEGWVQGSCDVPYLGGASISVTGVVFSGTAVFQNCNTDATGGPKAIGTGNTGVLYNSSHRNTCVWALPEPVPPPSPYTRRVWDVNFGIPDDPPCLTPGYVELANTSPGY